LTICNGKAIQSYYKEYAIKTKMIDDDFRKAVDDISNPISYKIITDVKNEDLTCFTGRLHIFYWVPKT
jgi:hypothetical protein